MTGLLAGSVLAASMALTVAAPASVASVVRSAASSAGARPSAAGPSGVRAKAAAIEVAATGRLAVEPRPEHRAPDGQHHQSDDRARRDQGGGPEPEDHHPVRRGRVREEVRRQQRGLRPGDKLTAGELLYALLLPSGADAAYALAEVYGPGIPAFITKMNATAKLMGMSRTHFSNFDGLPWPTPYSNYSTAANLLTLGRFAMRSALFRSIVDQRSYRLAAGSGHHAYRWQNINPLLGRYPGAIGIKPGYTGAAGQCLLFEASRNGYSLIGVTLDGPGSITTPDAADATRLLNWAFGLPGA